MIKQEQIPADENPPKNHPPTNTKPTQSKSNSNSYARTKLLSHCIQPLQKLILPTKPNPSKQPDNSMWVFHSGDKIANHKKNKQYEMIEILGQGTFGQVISCINSQGFKMAMKIFKKQPAYINQGLLEVKMLREISKIEKATDGSKSNYLNLYDAFMWEGYLCIAMQIMDNSLLEILESSNFRGLQMKWIEKWTKELLLSIIKMHCLGIYHSDIKPQNIMFRPQEPEKPILIDFSSACTSTLQPFTYLQSRFYRAPEVLIGLKPYTQKIDIWSIGCCLVELYLGLPLFPGSCSYDQLAKICNLIPYNGFSIEDLQNSKNGLKYFSINTNLSDDECIKLITEEEYEESGEKFTKGEDFYKFENLTDMLVERNFPPKDTQTHELFVDLIKKMLVFDPKQRISAEEAFLHPFVGGVFSELEQVRKIQSLKQTIS